MSTASVSRVAPGVPAGGQFTTGARTEPDVALGGREHAAVTLSTPQKIALEGAFDSARRWHNEWLSDVRDGNDYTPGQVDAVDAEHLEQTELMYELQERAAESGEPLTLSGDDLEALRGVFASAARWHTEWTGYVRDGGDYDAEEIEQAEASHAAQKSLIAELEPLSAKD